LGLRLHRFGVLTSPPSLLFETHDRLSARDGDLTIDHSAICNPDSARDDVRANNRGRSDLEFVFDHEFSRDTSRDDGCLRVNLAFPFRRRRHAQRTADTSVTPNRAAHHERPGGFDITGKAATIREEGRRDAKLID
jgi:hypothetical protein